MNVAFRPARMTREQFLDWAGLQDGRYEHDGDGPVAMTGGTGNHSLICQNLYFALRSRLGAGGWRVLGPDAGLATVGETVRYPDAMVTRTAFAGTARLIPGATIVFEVVSPTSGYRDRIVKPREYLHVESLRRYVICEHDNAGLTVLARGDGRADWTSATLVAGDVLGLPEIGIGIPVADIFAGVELRGEAEGPASGT